MPSPVTVTKFATKKQAGNSRSIPNKGLNANQMADCIRAMGLEPLFLKPQNDSDIKAMIYSYSKQMKIPIILGIDLWNKKTWDIFLSKSISLKEDISEDNNLDDAIKIYYLWINLLKKRPSFCLF